MDNNAILSLIDARRFDEAKAALQARIAQNGQDLGALFLYISLAYGAEAYDEAASLLNVARQLAPQAAPVLALAGDIALVREQFGAALAFYEQAHAADPTNIDLARKLWREWKIHGDARAAPLAAQLLSRATGAAALHALAHDHAQLGDTHMALTLLDQALAQATPTQSIAIAGDRLVLTGLGEADLLAAAPHLSGIVRPAPLPAHTGRALTVIVTTNLTKKLKVNADKAPPSDVLIRETLASFVSVMQPPVDTKIVIVYDMPRDMTDPDHAPYLAALEKVANDYNAELRCRPAAGLKTNYLESIAAINTPYVMLLEHDWLFNDNSPTLTQIIDILETYDDIHLLRLNKRPNIAIRDDMYLWRTPQIADAPVLRTLAYSNNPHVLRVSKLQRDFLPVIMGEARHDGINGGAGGIEESMKAYLLDLAQQAGPLLAQRWAGTAVWGRENDRARLTHTGI